jgi:nicotinamidase-related amidase
MYPATALLVIDAQSAFLRPSTADVFDRISAHLSSPAARYDLVVAVRVMNPPGSLWERRLGWLRMRAPGEADLLPEIAARADAVLDKTGYSAATPPLRRLLRQRGIGRAAICGVNTDQCVLATAFGLWDAGIDPVVLEDLCASTSGAEAHERGLAVARTAFGEDAVAASGEVVRRW